MSEAQEWAIDVEAYDRAYGEARVPGSMPREFIVFRSRDFRAISARIGRACRTSPV